MKLRSIGFVAAEAGRGLSRNKMAALASITTAMISLVVLGAFMVLSLNLQALTSHITSQVEVRAFLSSSLSDTQVQVLEKKVASWPEVSTVRYVSRQEALKVLEAQFQGLGSVGSATDLLRALSVKTRQSDQVPGIAARLAHTPGVLQVHYARSVVRRLLAMATLLREAGLAAAVLLLLGALFLIHNAIRLSILARRREISIMRMVGASSTMIRWPFLFEGMLLGVLGSLLATGVVLGGYAYVAKQVRQSLRFLPLESVHAVLPVVLPVLLLLGLLMGLLGSRFSLGRALRQ